MQLMVLHLVLSSVASRMYSLLSVVTAGTGNLTLQASVYWCSQSCECERSHHLLHGAACLLSWRCT